MYRIQFLENGKGIFTGWVDVQCATNRSVLYNRRQSKRGERQRKRNNPTNQSESGKAAPKRIIGKGAIQITLLGLLLDGTSLFEKRLELSLLEHGVDDIASTDKLSLDVELGNSRPVAVGKVWFVYCV